MAELIEDIVGDFTVVTGGQFNAVSPRSVRTYARAGGSGAFQLELAPSMRDAVEYPDTAREFVLRLSEPPATRSSRCMTRGDSALV